MKLSRRVKPISYVKAHAAQIVRDVWERGGPLVVTQRGEARVVVMDVKEYEELQDQLALLKILVLGKEGARRRTTPLKRAFTAVRKRVRP
jgi:prevent-host-death family protein